MQSSKRLKRQALRAFSLVMVVLTLFGSLGGILGPTPLAEAAPAGTNCFGFPSQKDVEYPNGTTQAQWVENCHKPEGIRPYIMDQALARYTSPETPEISFEPGEFLMIGVGATADGVKGSNCWTWASGYGKLRDYYYHSSNINGSSWKMPQVYCGGDPPRSPIPTIPAPLPAPPLGQLAVGTCWWDNQSHSLLWDNNTGRLWMDKQYLDLARSANQWQSIDCWVTAYAAGTLDAIGQQYVLYAGQSWNHTFPRYDQSFGFTFTVWNCSPCGQPQQPAPPAPPPAPTPGYSLPAPGPGQLAVASCWWDGARHDLLWDGNTNRIYMDPNYLSEGRNANTRQSVFCALTVYAGGTREALGQRIYMVGGSSWSYSFPAWDPSFGFAWTAN